MAEDAKATILRHSVQKLANMTAFASASAAPTDVDIIAEIASMAPNLKLHLKHASARGTSKGDAGRLVPRREPFDSYSTASRNLAFGVYRDYMANPTANEGDVSVLRFAIAVVGNYSGAGKSFMLQRLYETELPESYTSDVLRLVVSMNHNMQITLDVPPLAHPLATRLLYAYCFGYPKQNASDALVSIDNHLKLRFGAECHAVASAVLDVIKRDFNRQRTPHVRGLRIVLLVDEPQLDRRVYGLLTHLLDTGAGAVGAVISSLFGSIPLAVSDSGRKLVWESFGSLEVGSPAFLEHARHALGLLAVNSSAVAQRTIGGVAAASTASTSIAAVANATVPAVLRSFELTAGHARAVCNLLDTHVEHASSFGLFTAFDVATALSRARDNFAAVGSDVAPWLVAALLNGEFACTKANADPNGGGKTTIFDQARAKQLIANSINDKEVQVPVVALLRVRLTELRSFFVEKQMVPAATVKVALGALGALWSAVLLPCRAVDKAIFESMFINRAVLSGACHRMVIERPAVWPASEDEAEGPPQGAMTLFAAPVVVSGVRLDMNATHKTALFPGTPYCFSPANAAHKSACVAVLPNGKELLGVASIVQSWESSSWTLTSSDTTPSINVGSAPWASIESYFIHSENQTARAIDTLLPFKVAPQDDRDNGARVLMFQMKMSAETAATTFDIAEALDKARDVISKILECSEHPLRQFGVAAASQITVCFVALREVPQYVLEELAGDRAVDVRKERKQLRKLLEAVPFHIALLHNAGVSAFLGASLAGSPFLTTTRQSN